MNEDKIISEFEAEDVNQPLDRFYYFVCSKIAKWAWGKNTELETVPTSYFDVLKSSTLLGDLQKIIYRMQSKIKEPLFDSLASDLNEYSGEDFVNIFAPDLFLGNPEMVFSYLKNTRSDDSSYSNLLSLVRLLIVLWTRRELYFGDYPALSTMLKSRDDYSAAIYNAYHNTQQYSTSDESLGFTEESFFNLWILTHGVEYKKEPISVRRNVIQPLNKLREMRTDTEHILQLFYVVKTYSHLNSKSIDEPIAYLRKVFLNNTPFSSADNDSAGTALFLEHEELKETIDKWRKIDSIDFLLSLFYPASSANVSIENSVVYTQLHSLFLRNRKLLIFEPNPLFVDQIIRDDRISNDHITIAFLSQTLVQIYKMEYPDVQFAYFLPDKFESTILTLQLCEIDYNHKGRDIRFIKSSVETIFDKILIFSRPYYEAEISNIIFSILDFPNLSSKTIVDLVIPHTLIEKNTGMIRQKLLQKCDIRWLLLFPHFQDYDWFKRNTLISFKLRSDSGSDFVPIIRSGCFTVPDINSTIICQDPWPINVPTSDFLAGSKTINGLWENFRPKPRKGGKRKSRFFDFSPEIRIWYSWSDGRGRYSYYAHPTRQQELRGSRGDLLYGPKEYSAKDLDTVQKKIESSIFQQELWDIIQKDIRKHYSQPPLSLKSFWFSRLVVLRQNTQYSDTYAQKLICAEQLANSRIGDSNDYKHLFSLDFPNLSDRENLLLWQQLNIILNQASKEHFIKNNPISEFVNSLKEKDKGYREARSALAKKSYTILEEQKMLDFLRNKIPENGRYVGAAISFYTGMTNNEICALSWKDFHYLRQVGLSQLWVYQTMDKNGTPRLIHSDEMNSYRRVPCVQPLSKILQKRKKYLLTTYGLTPGEIDELPIVCEDEIDIRIWCRPSTLKTIKDDLERSANIEPISGIVSYNDDSNDSIKITDFNDYHADRFRSNIRYRATQTCNMSKAELNYIIGISMPTTFSKHYCDYTNDFAQLMLCRKLERWCAAHISSATLGKTEEVNFPIQIGNKDGIRSSLMMDLKIDPSVQYTKDMVLEIKDSRGISVVHNIISEE